MPTFTEQVRDVALAAGADLVGFGPISRFANAPRAYHPRTIYPPTKTVIAIAVRQSRGTLKAVEEGAYWQAYNCDSYWYLNEVVGPRILREVVLFLEDHGYTSVPVHNPFHPHSGRPVREDLPDGPDGMLSLRVVGVACGLGELGLSKVLLTPQYGPRQRVYAVLTDAELEATALFEGTLCDECHACADACEAAAIGATRDQVIEIDGRQYAHATLDTKACGIVHRGDDPRYSPFHNGSEAPGAKSSYQEFSLNRFRHLSICVGRGCLRACLDHLEREGRLEARFKAPFIERERWRLTDPPA